MADANIPDIGKYHILELIGEGAMGVVYRATDSVLHRTVAIKVMNDAIARQEELRQRFLHEAQAAASLQHPNVVSIYDLGEVDGHLFIAMEFVPGVDLEQLIETGEPLSLQAKLDVVIDVLTGLSFAHKRGIVHRDIKPGNIRVGEDGRAKIMDFGVAHLANSKLTSTGASLGTPSYMAPEQIVGGMTSAATDVFAVGAVLYELLTGAKPFDGETLQNLFFRIITEKARPVKELKPGLPSALDRIVEKAMAKEPGDRFGSALQMADELSAVRSKLSGPSYPSSVSLSHTVEHAIRQSQQTKTQAKPRELSMPSVGAFVAIAVVAIAWTVFARSRPERVAPNVAPPPATATATATAPTQSATPSASPSAPAAPAAATPTPPSTATGDVATVTPPTAARAPAPVPSTTTTTRQRRAEEASRSSRETPPPRPVTQPPATAPSVASSLPPTPPPTARTEVVTPRPSIVSSGAVQAPPVSAPPAPAPATAADIAPTFDAYARAIESRDLGAIRRIYPGITEGQQRGFEQFFQSARNINVTFRVANLEGSATTTEARVTGTYAYEGSSGRIERQPVSFAATLRRDGAEWRLVSLR